MRSNFVGTEFIIYDKGTKGKENNSTIIKPNIRSELGSVLYQYNVLGTRGPRKMTVVIPTVDSQNVRKVFRPDAGSDSIVDAYKEGKMEGITVLMNKSPAWNEQVCNKLKPDSISLTNLAPLQLGAYCLNFNGRVTEASVKNFQLVEEDESKDIILQFGKVYFNLEHDDDKH